MTTTVFRAFPRATGGISVGWRDPERAGECVRGAQADRLFFRETRPRAAPRCVLHYFPCPSFPCPELPLPAGCFAHQHLTVKAPVHQGVRASGRQARLRLNPTGEHLVDSSSIHIHHFELPRFPHHSVPRCGELAQKQKNETAQGVIAPSFFFRNGV